MKSGSDEVGQRFREAAAAEKPIFSEELHDQVMAAAARRERSSEPSENSLRWWWLAGAIACAAVIGAVWLSIQTTTSGISSPRELSSLPPIPPIGDMVREAAMPVRTQLYDARYAYLDRDGERLARFLWRTVPGLSEQAHNKQEPH